MAYMVVVVSLPSDSIQTIKDQVNFPTKVHQGLEGVKTVLGALQGGEKRSDNCYVVVRDTDPTVSTSGTGSVSTSYNKP